MPKGPVCRAVAVVAIASTPVLAAAPGGFLPLATFAQTVASASTPAPTPAGGTRQVESRTNARDSLVYVWIAPGTFQMGCVPQDGECHDREKPRHPVTLNRGFWLGRTEVTVAAFERFVAETAYATDAERAGFSYAWDGRQFTRDSGLSWKARASRMTHNTRSCTCPGMMPRPSVRGPEDISRRRRNGSMRRAQAETLRCTCGGMRLSPSRAA
jgi:formylglycine-generating enzyme required for sulfatase activity